MISPTSVTDGYILQPSLLGKHKKTLEWLSAAILWKEEFSFFQKLLEQYARKFVAVDDKKQIDHYQNILTYYTGELINGMTTELRLHEKNLAEMLERKDETRTAYFQEHDDLMAKLELLNNQFIEYKANLYAFLEKAI